jgi:hypothetical protein
MKHQQRVYLTHPKMLELLSSGKQLERNQSGMQVFEKVPKPANTDSMTLDQVGEPLC